MVWDCLIGWVIILATMVGWSTGLVRSWTIPLSMIIATFLAQLIYIDLATVLVEVLHLESSFAIFTGYFFTWIGLVQYSDFVLTQLFVPREISLPLLSKLGGALLGFAKGTGAFVLAAMVAYAHNKVPEPPVFAWENQWILQAARDSYLLPKLHIVATQLDDRVGKFVLSDSAPRFRANFAMGNDPFADQERREEERGRNFVKGWKQFKEDLGDAFGQN